MNVTDEMVQRFLGWRLPETFAPDCYISFDRETMKKIGNGTHWPSGTNLLNDPEARAMLEHVAGPELEKLRTENANLRTVMIAAAEEIAAHWPAHCDAEGYGPANLMRRLENGIPAEYGYSAGDFRRVCEEAQKIGRELAAHKQAAKELEEKHHEVGEIEARAAEILAANAK